MKKMSWSCKNDKPAGVEIPAPPEASIAAQDSKSFAEGNVQAILAKGGPVGGFLWAHLHGKHNDRAGETKYTISISVFDDTNFPYLVAEVLNTKVEGVLDKPERHRHCFGTFVPVGEYVEYLKLAFENNVPLKVVISGDRDRNDWDWITSEAKELYQKFAAGEIPQLELLNKITNGEKPPFLR